MTVRRGLLERALRTTGAPNGKKGLIVVGPRGSGRTQFLQAFKAEVESQTSGELAKAKAALVDLGPSEGSFDKAVAAIKVALAAAVEAPGVAKERSLVETVMRAKRAVGRARLVLILDDFDGLAPFLSIPQQVEFRGAFGDAINSALVLGATSVLERCVIAPADRASYFHDVIHESPVFLEPLSVEDASAVVMSQLATRATPRTVAWVLEQVGSFVEWVAVAARALGTSIEGIGEVEAERRVEHALIGCFERRLRSLPLKSLWVLEDPRRAATVAYGPEVQRDLVRAGWLRSDGSYAGKLLARWLRSHRPYSRRKRFVPPHEDRFEQLTRAVELLNAARWERGDREVQQDIVESITLTTPLVGQRLRARPESAEEALDVFAALLQLLVDATQGQAGERELPACVYEAGASPVARLRAWKKALAERAVSEGAWHELVNRGIDAVIQLISELADAYPWQDERDVAARVRDAAARIPEPPSGASPGARPETAVTRDEGGRAWKVVLAIDVAREHVRVGGTSVAVGGLAFQALVELARSPGESIRLSDRAGSVQDTMKRVRAAFRQAFDQCRDARTCVARAFDVADNEAEDLANRMFPSAPRTPDDDASGWYKLALPAEAVDLRESRRSP